MADSEYEGQPEEIDEFAMFRARALGAESEYQLRQLVSRRGSPRLNNRTVHSNGSTADHYSSPNTGSVEGAAVSRTSSGRRRHASGQSSSGGSRSRKTVQRCPGDANGEDHPPLDGAWATDGFIRQGQVTGRQQLHRRTESTSSGGNRGLLSPGSFDEDGDVNGHQCPLQVALKNYFY